MREEEHKQLDFSIALQNKLKESLGADLLKIEHHTFRKANIVIKGLIVKMKDSDIAPVIYPDELYEQYRQGLSIDTMINRFLDSYRHIDKNIADFNKETLMTNAYTVVINADMNRELLKTVPHNIVAGNLAEVARFRVKSDAESNSSFLITNEHLKYLHMIDDEVLEIAHKNTENQEYKLQNLYKLTFDMMSDEESREIFEDEYKDDDVYVLTNKINLDGANVIASDRILKEVSEKIDSSFYVLPSSRHELILVPDKFNVDPKYLVQMVREVNLTLKQKDFLSDDIYYYNAKKRTLSIYSDAEKQEKSLSETIDKKHTMKH